MLNRPMHGAPALSTDNVAIDDFVIASTTSETERDAAAKAVRAFHEFWNTGDEAALKQALTESFADHALLQGSEGAKSPPDQRSARPSAGRVAAPHHS
jgi:hypothetical protein